MEREVREYKERERIEYASPFESVGWIPSEYVGIRELHIQNYDDRKVEKLNNLLKDLHDKTKGELSGRTVYDIIQGLDRNQSFLYDSTSLLKRLKEYALSNSKVSYCNITDDDYWAFFDVKCNGCSETCVDMSLIKVYLTLDIIEKIEAGFEKVVRHLIDSTTTMFHAKVTKVKRDDQICLWVSREDFFLLEQFVNINEGIFRSPLPFVAYRGKLGLSREFYDWTSHNAVQARLINDYFAVVNSKEDINIFDMYALYVKAWNGELPDNHLFAQLYKKSNAQELLILLETFSIIIGKSSIDNNHIFLNDDKDLWFAFGASHNWCQLDRNLRQYSVRNYGE